MSYYIYYVKTYLFLMKTYENPHTFTFKYTKITEEGQKDHFKYQNICNSFKHFHIYVDVGNVIMNF